MENTEIWNRARKLNLGKDFLNGLDELLTSLESDNKQLIITDVVSSACKKAKIIEVLNNRRKQAFDNDFHKYENNEMRQAIDIVVRLLPND